MMTGHQNRVVRKIASINIITSLATAYLRADLINDALFPALDSRVITSVDLKASNMEKEHMSSEVVELIKSNPAEAGSITAHARICLSFAQTIFQYPMARGFANKIIHAMQQVALVNWEM